MRDWKICLQGIIRGARAAFIAFPSNQLEPHQSSSRSARAWATRHWLHSQTACVMNEWIFQPNWLMDSSSSGSGYHRSITLLMLYWKHIPSFNADFSLIDSMASLKMTSRRRRRKKDLFKYYWNSSDYRSHVCACLIGLTFFCIRFLLLSRSTKYFACLYHLSFQK